MSVIDQKWVSTRKNHKCWGCGKDYLVRSEMNRITTIDSGDFMTTYWCRPCDGFYKEMEDVDDGIDFAAFRGEEAYQEYLSKFAW